MSAQLASLLQASGDLQTDRMRLLAHDLNNPLTAIRILAELLQDQVSGDEGRKDVSDIIEAVDLAGALIDGMESLTLLEEPPEERTPSPVDLSALLRRCIDRPALRRHVLLELPPQLQLSGDPRALSRCFTDIFINAHRLVNGAERIVVRVEAQADAIVMRILHPACAIPVHLRGGLFERHGAIELRQQQIPVSAAGLVYARAVVEEHGGSMQLQDDDDGAMVLVVCLPR
ncbi:MAG TPA: hypothetical protein ENK18_09555 [Deltaproteobacteria bacterium]|nr:hypothetical protein [Deltaproteobacteria bacterium]